MRLTLSAVAADAGAAWQRQRALLWPLAGLFLFLPSFAWLLLIDPPIPAADATLERGETGRDKQVRIRRPWRRAGSLTEADADWAHFFKTD